MESNIKDNELLMEARNAQESSLKRPSNSFITKEDVRAYIPAAKETILVAVHLHKYKNGLFASLISPQSSIITDLHLLSRSALTTPAEKRVIKEVKSKIQQLLDSLIQDERETTIPCFQVFCETMAWMTSLTHVFEEDMRASGQYVPLMFGQVFNPDGSVSQTTTFRDSGVQTYEGGVAGIPSDAPAGFDTAIAAAFRDSKTKNEGWRIFSRHRMSMASHADMLSAHDSTNNVPSPKGSKSARGTNMLGNNEGE